MDVIPFILSERDVESLSDEMLSAIANCSTEGVLEKVQAYLSSNEKDEAVAKRVRVAYADAINLRDYLQSSEVADAVNFLENLTYDDISISLSLQQLQQYQSVIRLILDNKYAVPYISPVKKEAYDAALDILGSNPVAGRMKKASALFKDPPRTPFKGTPVKKIIRNRTQYEIILRGVGIIIERKQSNMTPNEWRYL